MSHNVEYREYDENVKRDAVQKELDHYVACQDWQEGCTGLNKPIRWLESVGICGDREEAEKAIEKNDKGWYDQIAVRFYDPEMNFSNSKVEQLKTKQASAWNAYNDSNDVWAKGLKAEYIGCRNCGSKLKRELIRSNKCPVCFEDMRPDGLLKELDRKMKKYKAAQEATKKYINTYANKKIKWLVKIEYHT